MDQNMRAVVALVVARASGRRIRGAVYDLDRRRPVHVTGIVSQASVDLFDHDRGVHIGGTASDLFEDGAAAHVSLQIAGDEFNGYDYAAGYYYSGSINEADVTIYDHQTSQHHRYALQAPATS